MGIINRKPRKIASETTEIAVIEDGEISLGNIKESDLPTIIGEQVQKLNELDESVREAIKMAENATNSATSARSQSAGFGHKKKAIEALQGAGYDIAKAVMSGVEAQKISFEFQRKLSEISKYLFALGVSNIALNRSTVRQLQLKMKGASEQELSDLAKREIINVIKQLKAQEDILFKQENLEKDVKLHHISIKNNENKINATEKKTKSNLQKLKSLLTTHDLSLENNENKINATERKAKSNFQRIKSLLTTVDELTNSLASLKKSVNQQNKKINEFQLEFLRYKKMFFISCIVICVILILSIISLVFSLIK
ncbi:MAG: hypothetical protein LBI14_01955 [Treponema sp.]|jgi:uncharacterized protein involved in exopolysaccharide biosynthesis|nr:hypothetical protein [Treponema sp.]